MSMRPSPDEVRAWLAQELAQSDLHSYLAILEADPNWHVFNQLGASWMRLTMQYGPTGEVITVVLRRVPATDPPVWQRSPS